MKQTTIPSLGPARLRNTPLACETGNAILGVFWGLLITTAVVGAGVLVWMVA